MSEMTVNLGDFEMDKSLFDTLNYVAYSRGETLDFIGFLKRALVEWVDGVGLNPVDRQRAEESLQEAFQEHRKSLVDLMSAPESERTPIFLGWMAAEHAWFRLNRRCPECGGPVGIAKKNKLYCSRRCATKFCSNVWEKRQQKKMILKEIS